MKPTSKDKRIAKAIIDYMYAKNEILFQKTGLNIYFNKYDAEFFKNRHFTEGEIKAFITSKAIHDADICPFCILIRQTKYGHFACDNCFYISQHGDCVEGSVESSDYKKLNERLTDNMSNFHEIIEIFEILQEKIKAIIKGE